MINRRDFCGVLSVLPFLKFDNDPLIYHTDSIIKTVSTPGIHLIQGPVKSGKSILGKYLKSKNKDIVLVDCVDGINRNIDFRDFCAINRIALKNKIPFLMEVRENVTIGALYLADSIYRTKKNINHIDVNCHKSRYGSIGGVTTLETRTLFELGKHEKFNDFRSHKQAFLRTSNI